MNTMCKLFVAVLCILLPACGSGGGSGSDGTAGATGGGQSSNKARFSFDCDLNGANGDLTMDVEAIGTSGVVFGSGASPDITGVIATGSVLYVTSGRLESATASYSFTGENNFADFVDSYTRDRFRVEWIQTTTGLYMVVNPFGPGPTMHDCKLTGSMYL